MSFGLLVIHKTVPVVFIYGISIFCNPCRCQEQIIKPFRKARTLGRNEQGVGLVAALIKYVLAQKMGAVWGSICRVTTWHLYAV